MVAINEIEDNEQKGLAETLFESSSSASSLDVGILLSTLTDKHK